MGGCTQATLHTYRGWLERFLAGVPDVTPLTVRDPFVSLQEQGLSASRQHQAYRTLKTFFRWCVETGALADMPPMSK